MTEPVVTNSFCARPALLKDDIPIRTNNPVRASRLKYAVDSMAIKPLQKILIQALASSTWAIRIFLDRLRTAVHTSSRQTAKHFSPILFPAGPGSTPQTSRVIPQNVNFAPSSMRRPPTGEEPYLMFATPKFGFSSIPVVRACPGIAKLRDPSVKFSLSFWLNETFAWLRKLKADA